MIKDYIYKFKATQVDESKWMRICVECVRDGKIGQNYHHSPPLLIDEHKELGPENGDDTIHLSLLRQLLRVI